MVKDVVCGMGVEEDAMGTFSRALEGKKYFFCSAECLLLFSREPLYYLGEEMKNEPRAKDLVCGMEVDESNSPFTAKYKGKIYYFCSHSCKREFEREPVKFITDE